MPEIDATIVYEAPWMKASSTVTDPGPDLEMIERLSRHRFDAAVIFTVYSQSPLPAALMCRLSGVPLRLAHCRENPYGLLTDWVREPEPDELVRHEVRRQLDLVGAIGARVSDERLRLTLPARTRDSVRERLSDAGLRSEADWLLVHPGSTASSRRYPPELCARVCAALARDHGVQLVFSGDPRERELVDQIREAAGAPSISLAGRLDLAELSALVAAAPVLLAGNTGPVHLAAATGTAVVDLYALTNPQHTPWQVPSFVLFHDVPCRWCYKSVCPEGHHLCLAGVAPDAVVGAVLALLRDRQKRPPEHWSHAIELG
jgi:ADP-heptose:LPS heptosyltransferase